MEAIFETIGHGLRSVMRNVPSPVVVVTAMGQGEPRGITIGSFTSVSLDPPLVSFNVRRAARMHAVLADTSSFAVHVLREDQAALGTRFSTSNLSGEEQFAGVSYYQQEGLPVLADALAVLVCERYAAHPAGDHSIVVGAVRTILRQQDGPPMLYHNRSFCSIGSRLTA